MIAIIDLKERIDSLLFIIKNIKREDIKIICNEALIKNLSPQNVIKVHNCAKDHEYEIIVQSTIEFILENFEKVRIFLT